MSSENKELVEKCISLLKSRNIPIDEKDFRRTTFVKINGYDCTFANDWGVKVNKEWFKEPPDKSKPFIKRKGAKDKRKIDFQLFPQGNKLFALHYLELRAYALELEDIDDWHNATRWGMKFNYAESKFKWQGMGNTKTFPLREINTVEDFSS